MQQSCLLYGQNTHLLLLSHRPSENHPRDTPDPLFLQVIPLTGEMQVQMLRGGLGLVISKDHVAMDPIKVQGVTDWPQPVKVKDIQSFIGFMNFYQRFIHNSSEIACPLHVLTWKSKDWSWGAAEQQAFDALKSTITSTPMLAFPSKSGPFCLECDASNFATGAVLSQQQE